MSTSCCVIHCPQTWVNYYYNNRLTRKETWVSSTPIFKVGPYVQVGNVMQNEEKEYHLTIIYVRNKSAKPIVVNIELLLDSVSFRSCDVIYLFISCERTYNKRPVHSFSKSSYTLKFDFLKNDLQQSYLSRIKIHWKNLLCTWFCFKIIPLPGLHSNLTIFFKYLKTRFKKELFHTY